MAKKSTRPQDQKYSGPSAFDHPHESVSRMGKNQLVRFSPCGYIPTRSSGLGFWVRMKKPSEYTETIQIKGKSIGWVHVDTPDRELLLTKQAMHLDQERPLNSKWDYFVANSFTHNTGEDYPIDRYMVNPHSFSQKDYSIKQRIEGKHGTSSHILLSDSGGFQLRSGLSQWVDPEELAEFYLNNVDEGMALDIPCGNAEMETMLECADVQILNGKFLKEATAGSGIRLGTIVHGIEVPHMKKYKRYIEDADADWSQCAFPSSMSLPALKQIDRLMFLLSNGAQYSQYHMLGLYNLSSSLVAIRLAHLLRKAGREVMITSDASTAYFSAKWRAYHSNPAQFKSIERMLVGRISAGGSVFNPSRHLGCQCTVCSNIKYMDVLALIDCEQTALLLARHNELDYMRWMRMMNEYAATLDDAQYRELVSAQMSGGYRQQTLLALDYVEVALQDGWEAAHRKFQHLITSMFDTADEVIEGPGGFWVPPDEGENVPKSIMEKRLLTAVHRYKEYYRTGKRPQIDKGVAANYKQLKKDKVL